MEYFFFEGIFNMDVIYLCEVYVLEATYNSFLKTNFSGENIYTSIVMFEYFETKKNVRRSGR